MNAHVKFGTEIALQRSLADVVDEYDAKRAALADAVRAFERAGTDLKMAATARGATCRSARSVKAAPTSTPSF